MWQSTQQVHQLSHQLPASYSLKALSVICSYSFSYVIDCQHFSLLGSIFICCRNALWAYFPLRVEPSEAPSEHSVFLLSRQGAHLRLSGYWTLTAGSQGRSTAQDLLWMGELPSLSLPCFSHLQDYREKNVLGARVCVKDHFYCNLLPVC